MTWWTAATRRRASPTWSLPATVILLSGRRTSVRTMLSLCALDRIFDDAVVFTIKGKASGEGSWRRLHCVLLPAHRLTHNRPGKQYCRGLAHPGLAISFLPSPAPKCLTSPTPPTPTPPHQPPQNPKKKTKKNPPKKGGFSKKWSECNYRTWKNPVISMVCK